MARFEIESLPHSLSLFYSLEGVYRTLNAVKPGRSGVPGVGEWYATNCSTGLRFRVPSGPKDSVICVICVTLLFNEWPICYIRVIAAVRGHGVVWYEGGVRKGGTGPTASGGKASQYEHEFCPSSSKAISASPPPPSDSRSWCKKA